LASVYSAAAQLLSQKSTTVAQKDFRIPILEMKNHSQNPVKKSAQPSWERVTL
jgi:hypothetical protein